MVDTFRSGAASDARTSTKAIAEGTQSGLSPEQVIQQLRAIRFGRNPSLASIARTAGISRRTIYDVINTGHATPRMSEALAMALQSVQKQGYQIPRPRGS